MVPMPSPAAKPWLSVREDRNTPTDSSAALEGLLPGIMKQISLFERFYTFVNGVFDLTGVVYYLSVIVFFLFLTVQSLEKRRYN